MYLRELRVMNDGPIEDVGITFPFSPDGNRPAPSIVVGENGSGKSNLLSIIADAIVEGASQHHSDVLAEPTGISRPWFRVVGGATIRRGASGGFALLRFDDGEAPLIYAQKAGQFEVGALPGNISPELRAGATWPDSGSSKLFTIEEERSRSIYSSGCYAYFPASRSEAPHWLNRDSLPSKPFGRALRFTGRLGKQLFVEQGLEALSQWIPGIILDSRATLVPDGPGVGAHWRVVGPHFQEHQKALEVANRALAIILDDPGAQFLWNDRFEGLLYASPRASTALPLSTLSSGQATLLSIFGNVLLQCDAGSRGAPLSAPGICVIDEVDAHVHVDLAYRAIPELIALFPLVQFIVSAHSPLFVLGMQAKFGDGEMALIEMPKGRSVSAEGYSEFWRALEVLRVTQKFDSMIADRINAQSAPIVLCEGVTDPRYLAKAAEVLGRSGVLDGIVLDWIGRRDSRGGSEGAGADNLNRAWQLLTTNPDLVSRPVLLLYDNDVRVSEGSVGRLSRRQVPTNPENEIVETGIENLLSPSAIKQGDFREDVRKYPNGKQVTVRELDKAALCDRLCGIEGDASHFEGFSGVLDIIQRWRSEQIFDSANQSPASPRG